MNKKEREKKVEALLSELTLEEKISMIHGSEFFKSPGVERLGIPPIVYSDGPMGVRNDFRPDQWKTIGTTADEVCYAPCNSAIAATWNRSLAWSSGRMLGEEARGRGKDMLLAPGINIKRNPLCGRNFEYMSEDPCLISELVVPLIEGIQEVDVSACVKHFICNAQEAERYMVNVELSDRTLQEIYLPGFEAAVRKAKSRAVMAAYNLIRGKHCCENKWLLNEHLRGTWKYDGLIVSDWGGNHDTKDAAESALDVEMGVKPDFDNYFMADPLLKMVKSGEIDESLIDEKIRNILRFMLYIRMIDVEMYEAKTKGGKVIKAKAVPVADRDRGCYSTVNHIEKALDTAREAVVLLKNENGRLPINPQKTKKILVIGDNANRKQANGGGSAEIKALFEITPLLGIAKAFGGNTQVKYTKGYYVPPKKTEEFNWQAESVNIEVVYQAVAQKKDTAADKKKGKELRDEAVKLAKEYDEVIFVGGLDHDYDVEDHDRTDMKLPYGQDETINAVLDANPNTVIVMVAGSPVEMSKWADRAKAIIWMGYNGMEGGTALGEVITGAVNPSGKLPETLPVDFKSTPVSHFGDYPGRKLKKEEAARINAHLTQNFNEGVFVGYRYYEKFGVPVQFPFGHGLSYTSFKYSGLAVKNVEGKPVSKRKLTDGLYVVSVKVKNVGTREGSETVQFYVGEEVPSKENPVKELKGFDKVSLKPGEEKVVSVVLPLKAFAHYDEDRAEWVLMKGKAKVYAAASSADVRLEKTIKL